jgi:PAS domain S-box-containing protein
VGDATSETLLDLTQDKIALLDETGRFTYVNAAAERLLGWPPAALEGENAFDYIHPDDVEAARSAFQRTIDSETFTETTVEYRLRARDGSWVPFEGRMSNLTDSQLDGYVISSREISDLVQARRERARAARQLEELSNRSNDVLWTFDADWSETLFVNPAYETVYGQPVEELRADPAAFLEAIHPEDLPVVTEAMERLSAGESVDMEYRVNPDADYGVWVWVQAEPVFEDGEVVRIVGFSRDITDRHRRLQQLYVMDNLLRHNLRNDLNVVLGNAERAAARAPEVDDLMAVIQRTAEDLLVSAGKQRRIIELLREDVERTRLDLAAVTDAAVGTVRERHPEATIELSTPETAPAHALEEFRLAVRELVENAVVHSDAERPSVGARVRVDPEVVSVVVADDGPPMPDIEAAVLTGEHEMNAIYHSTGLGLWLVYWIVELSGGRITVSRSADGNRTAITVPRAE